MVQRSNHTMPPIGGIPPTGLFPDGGENACCRS